MSREATRERVLQLIREHGPATTRELAECSEYVQATIQEHGRELADDGEIIRRPNPRDPVAKLYEIDEEPQTGMATSGIKHGVGD